MAGVFAISVWLFAQHMQIGAITADWGWLYRAGQAIRADGLPRHDLFSWTFPDRPWVLYQWLFEVVAAPLYTTLGLSGSVFGVGLLGLTAYAFVPAAALRRDGVHPVWPLLIGALILLPVSTNLGLRPMLASNFALLAQYLVIQRLRRGQASTRSTALCMAAIYALWSNMHLGFTLGLFSISLFAAGDLWTRARRPAEAANSLPDLCPAVRGRGTGERAEPVWLDAVSLYRGSVARNPDECTHPRVDAPASRQPLHAGGRGAVVSFRRPQPWSFAGY